MSETEEELRELALNEMLVVAVKEDDLPRVKVIFQKLKSLKKWEIIEHEPNIVYTASLHNSINVLEYILAGQGSPLDLGINYTNDNRVKEIAHYAIFHQNKDMIRLLHKHNADFYYKSTCKFIIETKVFNFDIDYYIENFKRLDDDGGPGDDIHTPLNVALILGNKEIIELLLELGVDPHSFDTGRYWVITNSDILQTLFDHGFDVKKEFILHYEEYGGKEVTLWHEALVGYYMYKDIASSIDVFIKNGADINDIIRNFSSLNVNWKDQHENDDDYDTLSILEMSIKRRDKEMVLFLLKSGVEIDIDRLLDFLCHRDDKDFIELFISYGIVKIDEVIEYMKRNESSFNMSGYGYEGSTNVIHWLEKYVSIKTEEMRIKVKKEIEDEIALELGKN